MDKINHLLEEQEKLSAIELIKHSYQVFDNKLIATTSFGATSGVIIHLIYMLRLPIKIIYINTGYLFQETINYIEQLKNIYKEIEFIELKPSISKEEFSKRFGNNLPQTNPDLCCRINKIEPFAKYLKENGIKAWIAGLRSEQTDYRKGLHKITKTEKGYYKVCPILTWTSKEIYYYMKKNSIPFHPLYEIGYTSIGCEPCTDLPTSDERSGRWKGKSKKECGLHTEL